MVSNKMVSVPLTSEKDRTLLLKIPKCERVVHAVCSAHSSIRKDQLDSEGFFTLEIHA